MVTSSAVPPPAVSTQGIPGPPITPRLRGHSTWSRYVQELRRLTPSSIRPVLVSARVVPGAPRATRLQGQSTWFRGATDARRAIQSLLFTASSSVSFAWMANAIISRGYWGVSRQSRTGFLMCAMSWSHFFVGAAILFLRGSYLSSLHFLTSDGAHVKRTSVWIVRRILQRSWRALLFFTTLDTTSGLLCGNLPAAWQPYKLEIYCGALSTHSYAVIVDYVAHKIFRQETVEGSVTRDLADETADHSRELNIQSRRRRNFHVFRQHLLLGLSSLAPTIYIHAMMQWVSIPASRVLLFTFISYAVKIVFQEYIKHQVLQQKVQSRRFIAVYVSMLTIVVDSQMRKGWKSPREPSNLSWPCGILVCKVSGCIRFYHRLQKLETRPWQSTKSGKPVCCDTTLLRLLPICMPNI